MAASQEKGFVRVSRKGRPLQSKFFLRDSLAVNLNAAAIDAIPALAALDVGTRLGGLDHIDVLGSEFDRAGHGAEINLVPLREVRLDRGDLAASHLPAEVAAGSHLLVGHLLAPF